MPSTLFDRIRQLTELSGPSGEEGPVQDALTAAWQEGGATVERTALGNIVAYAGGTGPRLLLAAHADELCYYVRAIDPAGYLWLANGQGWARTTSIRNWFTVGSAVRVLARSETLPGYLAAVTGHVATLVLDEPKALTWDDFWVDTGLPREELLERGVTPGTRIIWDVQTRRVGRHIVGKACDDRVALAVLTQVLERVPLAERRWDLTLVATVQEEIGLVGASALAARQEIAATVVVESGLSGDVPRVGDLAVPARLGDGPTLVHKDSMVHYDVPLTRALEQAATSAGIKIQHAVFGSYGSDGAAFMKAGLPAALVAFPTRYTHSPFETVDERDLEMLVAWLSAFLRRGR